MSKKVVDEVIAEVIAESKAAEEVVEYTFDLRRVSLDEALAVIEVMEKPREKITIADNVAALRLMRRCLVTGSKELTAADVWDVFQGFMATLMGAGEQSKN